MCALSLMNKDRSITQEDFDKLLSWLAPNREEAGRKYEAIRLRLIKIFTCRSCNEAEDLADETINRVTLKIRELAEKYVGDPALYFYGVAQKVYLEYSRRRREPVEMPQVNSADDKESAHECLERCMKQLPSDRSQLILQYYQENKRAKIGQRKELAKIMGIGSNALRIRAYRIRAELEKCVHECLKRRTLT